MMRAMIRNVVNIYKRLPLKAKSIPPTTVTTHVCHYPPLSLPTATTVTTHHCHHTPLPPPSRPSPDSCHHHKPAETLEFPSHWPLTTDKFEASNFGAVANLAKGGNNGIGSTLGCEVCMGGGCAGRMAKTIQ